MRAEKIWAVAVAISCLLAGWYAAPCNCYQTAQSPAQEADGGSFDSCPPPNPAVQALAGHRYALRACVVCPMVATPRAPRPVNPVTNRVEYYFQQASRSRYITAMRNEASGPVRITEVSQMGEENDRQWLQPGEEFRGLLLPGAWLRAYAAAGELLLEHHVGLTPILSTGAIVADTLNKSNVGIDDDIIIGPRYFPPKISKGWSARSKRFATRAFSYPGYKQPRPDGSVTVGFLNLAGHGVDLLSHSAVEKVSELLNMIPDEESRLHNANVGHKFSFNDEAGRGMGKGFVVEDVVVRDCKKHQPRTHLIVAAGIGIGQQLDSVVPSFTFGSIGMK